MYKLGFIGLGKMGGAICRSLIDHGNDVTVFDVKNAAVAAFADKATIATNAIEVLETSDIIFLSLPASQHVSAILEDFLAHNVSGKTIVDTSTSYPETTRTFYQRLHAVGGSLVDLGISGAPDDACKGQLLALFGGDAEQYELLKPLVSCFASRYSNLGGSGNGHTAKVLFNFIAMSYVNIYAMAFPLANKMGLDMQQLFDLLKTTGMGCGTMNFYVPKMINRTFDMAFALELAHKDLTYCRNLFEAYQVPAFALDGELAMLRTSIRDGKGKMDYSACIDTMFEYFDGK